MKKPTYDYENGCVGELWAGAEYKAFDFSRETYEAGYDCYNGISLKERNQTNWGTDNATPMINTYEATNLMCEIMYGIQPASDENVDKVIAEYNRALAELETMYEDEVIESINSMTEIEKYLREAL